MSDRTRGGRSGATRRAVLAPALAAAGVLASAACDPAAPPAGPSAAMKAAATPDPGWEGVRIPEFALVDQSGIAATEAILDGRVTIADFMFTNCPFVCPGMTGAMWDLSQRLKGTGVRFLSVSVDPGRDTPGRLADYAARADADLSRWSFLTGDKAVIDGLVRGTLMFELSEDEATPIALPDGSTMNNIIHPSHLVLIGPDRQILGLYDFSRDDELAELADRARTLAGRP